MAQVIETNVSIVCDICKETKVTFNAPVEVGQPSADDSFVEISVRHKTAHVCLARCVNLPFIKIVAAINDIPVC